MLYPLQGFSLCFAEGMSWNGRVFKDGENESFYYEVSFDFFWQISEPV